MTATDDKKKKKGHQPQVAPIPPITIEQPVQTLGGTQEVPVEQPPIPRVDPSVDAKSTTVYGGGYGAESVRAEPTQLGTEIQPQPMAPIPSLDVNAEAAAANYPDRLNAIRSVSPYRRNAQQQQAAIDVIRTMPLTDKKGDTISPTENPYLDDARRQLARNSRWRSAFGAAFKNMAANPRLANARGWGDVLGGVAGGAGAGIAGGVFDSWDEEAKRIELIERLGTDVKQNLAYADKDEDNYIQQTNAELAARKAEIAAQQDQASQEASLIKWAYNALEDYDPESVKFKELTDRAKRAGIPLFPKDKEQKWQIVTMPNGDAIMWNPETQEQKPLGNFAKPATISDNDLPDNLFGLKSDSDISTEAASQVGKLPEGRRLRPQAMQLLSAAKDSTGQPYIRSDGSFNESQYWADRANDDTGLSPTDLYENIPSSYEQRIAGTKKRLADGQRDLRENVTRFRTVLKNMRPQANAQPVPLLKLVDLFKTIMSLPAGKEKQKRLDMFYGGLNKFRIE